MQADYFKALLLRPLRSSDAVAGAEAAKLLQALVGQILLRRTKDSTDKNGKKLFELPPIEYFRCPIELDEETRGLYKEVLDRSKERFLRAVQEGTVSYEVDQIYRFDAS
jgi:SWI/SNF-related matrix-associated actin-dependent regulator of chromatin subfamily A3